MLCTRLGWPIFPIGHDWQARQYIVKWTRSTWLIVLVIGCNLSSQRPQRRGSNHHFMIKYLECWMIETAPPSLLMLMTHRQSRVRCDWRTGYEWYNSCIMGTHLGPTITELEKPPRIMQCLAFTCGHYVYSWHAMFKVQIENRCHEGCVYCQKALNLKNTYM